MEVFEINKTYKYGIMCTQVDDFKKWLMNMSTALAVFTPSTKLHSLQVAYIIENVYLKINKATGKKGWFFQEFLSISLNLVEVETLYMLLENQPDFQEEFKSIYGQLHLNHNRHFSWEREKEGKSPAIINIKQLSNNENKPH